MAQERTSEIAEVGAGVAPPRVLSSPQPHYSKPAIANRVEGAVVIELIVDESGRPTNITVVKPLGFGLDELAQEAVETWQFAAGMKEGRPVRVFAMIDVHFRLLHSQLAERAEKEQAAFDAALRQMDGAQVDAAVESIKDLANRKFVPAVNLLGVWKTDGSHVSKDEKVGLKLIQQAAEKDFGPAIYELASRCIQSGALSKDPQKALDEMQRAAMLGSVQAQLYLGNRFEKGEDVPPDLDKARIYFRLCAARGAAVCQYRLGKLLLDARNRTARDYVQAIAWLQFAQEKGVDSAASLIAEETAHLTPQQIKSVNSLKQHLATK